VYLHDAGLEQLQAREEPADLSLRAGRDRGGGLRVVPLHALGHLVGGNVARDLRDGQVTARRHGTHEPADDRARVFPVGNSLQDPEQHDRDRLPEVQDAGCPLHDRGGGAQVGVDVGGRPFRAR